ncbi:hypothetical protein Tsp_08780 [Trichinella spiralis]|uniref:hypothetical protein n=1 Tax=Trichinella spiralis TaxID=6334 RepID=UPI0001EFE4CB|nr:hypothetical protein Tsp_08780 [Trichinella spiralis]
MAVEQLYRSDLISEIDAKPILNDTPSYGRKQRTLGNPKHWRSTAEKEFFVPISMMRSSYATVPTSTLYKMQSGETRCSPFRCVFEILTVNSPIPRTTVAGVRAKQTHFLEAKVAAWKRVWSSTLRRAPLLDCSPNHRHYLSMLP